MCWGDFYPVTGWCVSPVSCLPGRLHLSDALTATTTWVTLNERTWNGVNQLGFVEQWLGRHSSWHRHKNSNSHEPAAWHALGRAASQSCRLLHIKPSVDYRSLCPLRSIPGPNLWGQRIGHVCCAASIMDASTESPHVHPHNHLTVLSNMWSKPLLNRRDPAKESDAEYFLVAL